jgi:dihydroorotate dehydrogenase (fumarate)
MADLSTTYMGLKLKNPVVVASSGLVKTVAGVRACGDNGAGAVVLKSLFEQQVNCNVADLDRECYSDHPEAYDYIKNLISDRDKTDYLTLIREAKKAVSIPVIASINCVNDREWTQYAKDLEKAGADALELNISYMPNDPHLRSNDIHHVYYDIVSTVKKNINLPIAAKIGPYFTNLNRFAVRMERFGADALVLFNRFYQFDIDIEKESLAPGNRLSSPDEINVPLRWMAKLYGKVKCDLAASTGVHDGTGAVKQLLAGAKVVQLCSTLYQNKMKQIGRIRDEINTWMDNKGYETIDDFRGKLSQIRSECPEDYERIQYIKALVGIE